jgi:hypothetical protein
MSREGLMTLPALAARHSGPAGHEQPMAIRHYGCAGSGLLNLRLGGTLSCCPMVGYDWRMTHMELSNLAAIWCALMSTLQGVGAFYGLIDRRKKLLDPGETMPSKFNPLLVSILLVIGTIVTIAFGTWMFVAKPLRPKIVEKPTTIVVEKSIPCPPSKSGSAVSHGANSPANSGSNNTTTIGLPSPAQKSPN